MKLSDNTDALTRLRKKFELLTPITDDDFEEMAGMMYEKHFNKGEVILKEGQVCNQYYFIFSGCIRKFGLKDGREVNVGFYFEGDIACDFESFRQEVPSEFYLVAMEDCLVYYAVKTEISPFFLQDTSMHMFLFRFFQELYFKEDEHANSFKLLSPEERYQSLLKNKPAYLQRIPLIYLASYLGVSRETLNRIRKKIR